MAEFHNQAKIKLRIVVLAVVVVKCSNNKKKHREGAIPTWLVQMAAENRMKEIPKIDTWSPTQKRGNCPNDMGAHLQ